MLFQKYNGDFKQGQTWCANICYHSVDYRAETIEANEGKFAIYGANRDHYENQSTTPGTLNYRICKFYSRRIPGGDAGQVHERKD